MDVTVKMFHGGVIAGRVVDSYGEPLDNAEVRAMSFRAAGRRCFAAPLGTNDLGEFRLARLEPGRYVLNVTPRN